MKATGIVRRIDELGRVVIPKEIRRTGQIRVSDPLEIFIGDEGEVIFKKYSALGAMAPVANSVASALHNALHCPVILIDRESVVASIGEKVPQIGERVTNEYHKKMEERKAFVPETEADCISITENYYDKVCASMPILVNGDVVGSVAICSMAAKTKRDAPTLTAVRMAADIISKYLDA